MACSPYLVYTGVTDTGLCSGGGSPTTIYIDSAVIPFLTGTFVYSDAGCSVSIGDSFYFVYQDYLYNYSGTDTQIKSVDPCPSPTPTPTNTGTPTAVSYTHLTLPTKRIV